MDKQLIERALREEAAQTSGYSDAIIDDESIQFFGRVLARIDAERGKSATAFRLIDGEDVEYNGIDQFSCGRAGGEPLFLSAPTIPEGMALVPTEQAKDGERYQKLIHLTERGCYQLFYFDTDRDCWERVSLAAAQGERK